MQGFVYILVSRRNGTLYVGVTSDLRRRLLEHQRGLAPGFTSKYGVTRLVWFEQHELVVEAIRRERRLKKYPRRWKLNLIEEVNPRWDDLQSWLMDNR
ncbi:MAG TPA: GIY-YIG nuclease family protein [Devosiaceae bacterium]|jgi:putative endonuclease|nr:GIY-YIG nuclease family protein [Devosiaceae bacterium]